MPTPRHGTMAPSGPRITHQAARIRSPGDGGTTVTIRRARKVMTSRVSGVVKLVRESALCSESDAGARGRRAACPSGPARGARRRLGARRWVRAFVVVPGGDERHPGFAGAPADDSGAGRRARGGHDGRRRHARPGGKSVAGARSGLRQSRRHRLPDRGRRHRYGNPWHGTGIAHDRCSSDRRPSRHRYRRHCRIRDRRRSGTSSCFACFARRPRHRHRAAPTSGPGVSLAQTPMVRTPRIACTTSPCWPTRTDTSTFTGIPARTRSRSARWIWPTTRRPTCRSRDCWAKRSVGATR